MFCSQCGNEISAQAVICPKCGCATSNFQKQEAMPASQRDLLIAYIASFMMGPLAGIPAAIYLGVKHKVSIIHIVGVIALSLIGYVFWLAVLGVVFSSAK